MGVSFLAQLSDEARITLVAPGGRYEKMDVKVQGASNPASWWRRIPVSLRCEIPAHHLQTDTTVRKTYSTLTIEPGVEIEGEQVEPLDLRFEVVSRPHGQAQHLITVSLVNRTLETTAYPSSELILFQSHFEAIVLGSEGSAFIIPYP